MLNYKDKKLLKMLQQLDGMEKMDIYDLLMEIEMILFAYSSPLSFGSIKKNLITRMTSRNLQSCSELGCLFLIDSCSIMDIYEIKQNTIPKLLGGTRTYFQLKGGVNLIPFKKKNMLKATAGGEMDMLISRFLD